MAPVRSTIFIIDDDTSVRRALCRVMSSAGLDGEAFDSAEEFLAKANPGMVGCIVADMTMPGMSGLELKPVLDAAGVKLPLILLTAHDSEEMRAAARNAGAAAYFRKPVDTQALLDAIRWACHSPPLADAS
ncbi:MAG: response regulator [Verrucomicrobiota bacterium]